MNLKKYFTLTRAGIIEGLQFRASAAVMVAGNILYLIVVYFLWKSIYASSGQDIVNGMTFTDTLYLQLHFSDSWKCTRYLKWAEIYNAPLTILLNGEPDIKSAGTILGTQLFWCIATVVISKLFWKTSLRQITVNGG